MDRVGESQKVHDEVVGVFMLLLCVVFGWGALLTLVANVAVGGHGSSGATRPPLLWLGGLVALFVHLVQRRGLMALALRAQGARRSPLSKPWLCFLAHFKVSFVALLVALGVGWFWRVELLLWVVAPGREHHPMYFGSWPAALKAMVLVVLGVMWVPVVPFFASDLWRLLLPLMSARSARLRLPFAFTSALAVLGALWFLQWCGLIHSVLLLGGLDSTELL